MTRIVEGCRTETDGLLEGVKVEVTMDESTNYKNQWLVAAYWLSATIVYKNRGLDWISTIGGHCSCLIYIDTDNPTLKMFNCEDHMYNVSAEKIGGEKWTAYLGRGDIASPDLITKMNAVLARWNTTSGRKVEIGSNLIPCPEQLTKGFVDVVKSSIEDCEVQHARTIFDEAYDKFRELWTKRPVTIQSIFRSALQFFQRHGRRG